MTVNAYKEDPTYTQLKQDLTKGKRLPYKDYVYMRTIYYIRNLAEQPQLEAIQLELDQARFGDVLPTPLTEKTSSN